MKTPEQITEFLLNNIEDNFDIDYNEYQSQSYVRHNYGAYCLEFVLEYDYKSKTLFERTHYNPEEFEWSATAEEVSEIVVYKSNEDVELTDEQIEKIRLKILETIKPQGG